MEHLLTLGSLSALLQVVLIDIVLSLAGAAREYPVALVFGLALSIAMMGAAAMAAARLLERHNWITHLGLAVMLQVALRMINEGPQQVLHAASVT